MRRCSISREGSTTATGNIELAPASVQSASERTKAVSNSIREPAGLKPRPFAPLEIGAYTESVIPGEGGNPVHSGRLRFFSLEWFRHHFASGAFAQDLHPALSLF